MYLNKNYGLKKHGFITNLPGQLNSFNSLLAETGKVYTQSEQDALLDGVSPVFWNSLGSDTFDSKPIEDQYRVYKVLYTGQTTAAGEEVLGLLTRDRKRGTYQGVRWGTYPAFQKDISLQTSFLWLGRLAFGCQGHLRSFLSFLADMAIPEPWDTDPNSWTGGYDFLRSYIEHMFAKLWSEHEQGAANKILYSSDGSHILWNTNLYDRFGHDIIISSEVAKKGDGSEYFTSHRIIKNGIKELRSLGFSGHDKPAIASFFTNAEDMVYHPDWKIDIDVNFHKLYHAVEDNRSRFPKAFQGKSPDYVARCLTNAIQLSSGIARRDCRFIVPMYSTTHRQLQFLMPLFLGGQIKRTPDLAIILTADKGYYIPETVIGMREAYQDARLITKPSENWLK